MKIGIIGVGKMGGAMVRGMLKANIVSDSHIYLYDHHQVNLEAIKTLYPNVNCCSSESDVLEKSSVVILAVKPYAISKLVSLLDHCTNIPLVISVAAGVSLGDLTSFCQSDVKFVRSMPNTPASVGHGVVVYSMGQGTNIQDKFLVENIFNTLGYALELPEEKIDAAMSISGCGPAYMYVILDALSDAGVSLGLTRTEALTLAAHTMEGSAYMQMQTGQHPMALRDDVTSPGGVTIAALNELDALGLRHALISATRVAALKGKS